MSGAGSIKWDGSDDDYLIEVKDAQQRHQIDSYLLEGLWRDAIKQGKEPLYIIKFKNGMVAKCLLEWEQ